MSVEIKIPDIGDFKEVSVIEVLIKAGDEIQADQSVLILESDKASMEVPAEAGGLVEQVLIKVGDKVSEGDVIAKLRDGAPVQEVPPASVGAAPQEVDLLVPDIGTDEVSVIAVSISVGQSINEGDTLITLESDKASMEVPAEVAGTISSLALKVGDKVKTGSLIGKVSSTSAAPAPTPKVETPKAEKAESPAKPAPAPAPQKSGSIDEAAFAKAYASPAVRLLARELGADLGKITGTGRHGRILDSDVKQWVKGIVSGASSSPAPQMQGSGIPPIPKVDFSQFGEIEELKLSRINVLTGEAMTRCWLNIPHVTQHDYCDITDLEEFRKSLKAQAEKAGVRVTMLSFLMKALAVALKTYPRFNSSLAPDGKSLILKKYFNIGIAVDTPNGLVVPVIKDVDKKGIFELSADLVAISKKARDGKLSPKDMSGASMTISSLGGIGGQFFTPIVNAPEVAILGVSRSSMQPVWNGKDFSPRLMLPMSLSYDHRVIDGALGARMIVLIGQLLNDFRKVVL